MRALLVLALCALGASGADPESAAVRLDEVASADGQPRVTFPQFPFTLSAERPPGLAGVGTLSPAARFAGVAVGGRTIELAFDAPEGAPALGLLHAPGREPVLGHARPLDREGFAVDFERVACGPLRCNVRLLYRGYEVTGGVLQPAFHRRGRVALAGALREVIVVDADGDGRYDGPRDRWVALRVDRIAGLKTLRRWEGLLLDEPQIPFEEDGRALRIESMQPDCSRLTLVLDEPRKSMATVLARRYAEVRAEHFATFADERQAFLTAQGFDLARDRARTPASWESLSYLDALAAARRQGRPLLVLFFTESNPWCYRYEYYTFPDAEVDALLRRFVLVRIDAEKDPDRSYQTCGARGLPTLLPVTSRGEPVRFLVRTRDGDGTVRDLDEPERVITGWQRPQELVVNLRRILDAAEVR